MAQLCAFIFLAFFGFADEARSMDVYSVSHFRLIFNADYVSEHQRHRPRLNPLISLHLLPDSHNPQEETS